MTPSPPWLIMVAAIMAMALIMVVYLGLGDTPEYQYDHVRELSPGRYYVQDRENVDLTKYAIKACGEGNVKRIKPDGDIYEAEAAYVRCLSPYGN